MPLFRCVMGVLLLGMFSPTVIAQPVTDLAKLFPADTLAYAEIAKPDELMTSVKALVAGTPWADASKLLHDRYDRVPDLGQANAVRETALLTLFTSPEFLAEVTRLTGAAVAFTGYDAQHNPRYAAAILLGDSNATGLAIRLFLTTSSDVRRVGVIDGIPIYQHRTFAGQPLDVGQAAIAEPKNDPWPEGKAEITYAYTPGLFVIGSGRDAIADVLRRYQGKSKDASLAQSELFRGQQAARDRTGVFLYATPANWLAQYDAANKTAVAKAETDITAIIRFVAIPKSIPVVTATFSLDYDRIELRGEVTRDPKLSNPVASLLSGPLVNAGNFESLPGQPLGGVTLSLPPGELRVKSVLAVADAIAHAKGVIGKKPSEMLATIEQKPGRKPPIELLASVNAVTMFTPSRVTPSRVTPLSVAVLHLDTLRDADQWTEELPTMIPQLLGGESSVSEQVNGVPVFTMLTGTGDKKTAWRFAVTKKRVIISQDLNAVKAVITGNTDSKNWIPKQAVRPDTTALALLDLAWLLQPLFPIQPGDPNRLLGGLMLDPGVVFAPPLVHETGRFSLPEPDLASPSPLSVAIARAVKHLPSVSVSLDTKENRMPFVVRLDDAKKSLTTVLDKLLEPPPVPNDSDESKPVPKEPR